MHDWEMKGATSTFTGLVAGNTITNVSLTVPVKTLSAEKGKIMEKKAYEALKSDKAPKASVQQEFHCSCSARNETLVISCSPFFSHRCLSVYFVGLWCVGLVALLHFLLALGVG